MTDYEVEQYFIKKIENIGTPLIESTFIGGKVSYTNIKYENKSFTRPANGYWFELYYDTNPPVQAVGGSSGRNLWAGYFQINICVPKDSGKKAAMKRYEKIFNEFPIGFVGDKFPGLRILSIGRAPMQYYDDFSLLPMSIIFEAYLER